MKVLAFCEYDEKTGLIMGIPEKIYFKNKSIQQIDKVFAKAERLFSLEKNRSMLEQIDRANQYAEIQRLKAMGLVTAADVISIVENTQRRMINEAVHETKNKIWMDRQKLKFRNFIFKIVGSIIPKMLKK